MPECTCMHAKSLSHVPLFATPWAAAHQAPLSMGFSRQEYWSGLPCPIQGIFPTQGLKSLSYVSCIGRQVLYHSQNLGKPTGVHKNPQILECTCSKHTILMK